MATINPTPKSSLWSFPYGGPLIILVFVSFFSLSAVLLGCKQENPELTELRRRVEQGDFSAQFQLGLRLMKGDGVPTNVLEGVKLIRVAAEKGIPEAQKELGSIYVMSKGQPVEGARWLQKATDQGNYDAAKLLQLMYLTGTGVPRNLETNFVLHLEFAKRGYAEAQVELGQLYYTGMGVVSNAHEAVKWWRMAAEQSYPEGEHIMAGLFEEGRAGVERDESLALVWYRKAANHGHSWASFRIAQVYLAGLLGVKENLGEGMQFLLQAAEQGHAEAQFFLAIDFWGKAKQGGSGVTTNWAGAAEWLTRAADQHHGKAQTHLSMLYANGEAVPRNMVEAMKWCLIALSNGEAMAEGLVTPYSKDMSKQQQQTAISLADVYIKTHQKLKDVDWLRKSKFEPAK